jgi:hypothetical protein
MAVPSSAEEENGQAFDLMVVVCFGGNDDDDGDN